MSPSGTLPALFGNTVDPVGVGARADRLGRRSIKGAAKRRAIDLAIGCSDLTTLEGSDTVGRVRRLAAKAVHPVPGDSDVPAVAAVCVYPELVNVAVDALRASPVRVASVATAFPSGQSPLSVRLEEIRQAVVAGADEIDMVLNRGALLAGDDRSVVDDVAAAKDAADGRTVKVILETGELGSYSLVRHAALLAMSAGADFVKTSTGKVSPAATLPVAVVLAEAVRDHADRTGEAVGIKVAGGIRTTKDALRYVVVVAETLGDDWLRPERFRIGASSLLNDLLMQRDRLRSGTYADTDSYTMA